MSTGKGATFICLGFAAYPVRGFFPLGHSQALKGHPGWTLLSALPGALLWKSPGPPNCPEAKRIVQTPGAEPLLKAEPTCSGRWPRELHLLSPGHFLSTDQWSGTFPPSSPQTRWCWKHRNPVRGTRARGALREAEQELCYPLRLSHVPATV